MPRSVYYIVDMALKQFSGTPHCESILLTIFIGKIGSIFFLLVNRLLLKTVAIIAQNFIGQLNLVQIDKVYIKGKDPKSLKTRIISAGIIYHCST
mmetsp:Transcript_1306/g.2664  ORF Transcript_1306/g.2664 Transcript_1306/m.2664 type:complete len:95 (-) Transcript_1306:460-744(-)